MLRTTVGIIVMSLGIAAAANAATVRTMSVLQNYDAPSSVAQAPEIDPASAFSALTFLAGGLTIIRGRRAKK